MKLRVNVELTEDEAKVLAEMSLAPVLMRAISIVEKYTAHIPPGVNNATDLKAVERVADLLWPSAQKELRRAADEL